MSALAQVSPEAAAPRPDGLLHLTVTSKTQKAKGVVELVLSSASTLPSWTPGAHIDLHLGEFVRQYSLCGDPADSLSYKVAILKEDSGRGGSLWAHDQVAVGDVLNVGGPRNHFPFDGASDYLFIAGGIGVTPLIPMIAAAEAAGASWTLLYGGRELSSMAYVDHLGQYGERVRVRPQDEHGLLDLAAALDTPRADTLIYCCGPEPLLQAVERAAAQWPKGALRLERFAPKEAIDHEHELAFEVVFNKSGITANVPPGVSVLDVASANGIFVLKSCSEGVCGTCETLVLAGEPDHRDSVYTEDDYAEGAFAPCVSRCKSGRLVLDL